MIELQALWLTDSCSSDDCFWRTFKHWNICLKRQSELRLKVFSKASDEKKASEVHYNHLHAKINEHLLEAVKC